MIQLCNSIWWSTVSKAFCKSEKSPRPRALLIFADILIKAVKCRIMLSETKF